MKEGLRVGDKGRLDRTADAGRAITLGAGSAGATSVFCTPAMIDLMEHAARQVLRPFLEDGEESVGVDVSVKHLAATPVGAAVHAWAQVAGVEGRQIAFTVEAFDEHGKIGEGTHRRAIVKLERLRDGLKKRTEGGPPADQANAAEAKTPAAKPVERALANMASTTPPTLTHLLLDIAGPVVHVTLNRPDKLNAVNAAMTGDFERLAAWLERREDLRVVVMRGAGRAFCAGDDVKEVATLDLPTARELSLRQARVYLAFENLPQVIIAAIDGLALGGGCVLANACDFRVATHAASFGMPELKLGWTPGYGLSQLTALIGKARALDLCLTCRSIDAATALQWGLIHQAVAGGQLMSAAMDLAQRLLALPPRGLSLTKRTIHADEAESPKLTYLRDTDAYLRCLAMADSREGMAAFLEKRPAKFTGA